MNYGSIDKETTREAKLFNFLRANVGKRFTALELNLAIQFKGPNPCPHTYACGVRLQLEARPELGYRLPKAKYDEVKKLPVYWLEFREKPREIPSSGQLSLLEAVA